MFIIYALMTWGERDARQTVILAVCMSIAAVTVFVVILGQAMPTFTADYISPIFSKIGSIFSGIRGAEMDFNVFSNLMTGFAAAGTFQNIGFAMLGCMVGTLIGVSAGHRTYSDTRHAPADHLRARSPVIPDHDGRHLLRRAVRRFDDLDPRQHARRILVGRDLYRRTSDGPSRPAGSALAIAAIGSFFAGCVGTIFIAGFGPPLASFAQKFNSPDYFSLMVLGLVTAVILAQGSVLKA